MGGFGVDHTIYGSTENGLLGITAGERIES